MNLVTPNEADANDRRNVNPDPEEDISLISTLAFFTVETSMALSSLKLITPIANRRCICGRASMKGSETWIELDETRMKNYGS